MEAFIPFVPKMYKSSFRKLQLLQRKIFVDYHGGPSVQEAARSHFKSQDKDG